jgi:hypothetical protein
MIPENQLLDRAGPVHPPSLPLPALSERRHRSLARQLVSMRSSTYVATPGADAAQISCITLSSSAPSCTLFQSRSLAGQSIPADQSQKPSSTCRFILWSFANDLRKSGSVVLGKLEAHRKLLKPVKTEALLAQPLKRKVMPS